MFGQPVEADPQHELGTAPRPVTLALDLHAAFSQPQTSSTSPAQSRGSTR